VPATQHRETISTYVEREVADRLRKRAAAAERSLAAEMRLAVFGYLAQIDERRPPMAGAAENDPAVGGPNRVGGP
jgi:hypothetical protein